MVRTLPHAVEAERALLGAVLQMPKLADDAAELQPEHMHDPRHQHVWRAICELRDRSQPIDPVTVAERMTEAGKLDAIGGFAYVSKLIADRPESASAVARYAAVIREKATARELLAVLGELMDRGYTDPDTSGLLEDAQARVFAIRGTSDAGAPKPMREVLRGSLRALQERMDAGRPPGLKIGIPELDRLLAGWQPGDLVILGGRASMGKTACAIGLAMDTARHGAPVLMFSVEMGADQIGDRVLCSEADADAQKFRLGEMDRGVLTQIVLAGQRVAPLAVHIDDSSAVTIPQIRARVRRWQSTHGKHGLVVLDYLQLVSSQRVRGQSREQEVAEISRSLKAIARETGCTMLALAQLGRDVDKRDNQRPKLSDLRESGSLEQDADVVLFCFRPEYYDPNTPDKGLLELICAKQRKGPIGITRMHFEEKTGRLSPMTNRREF